MATADTLIEAAPAVAPPPATEAAMTPDAAFDIADRLSVLSSETRDLRMKSKALSTAERQALIRCEDGLDELVTRFRREGISLTGLMARDALDELEGATRKAVKVMKRIEDVGQAIDFALLVLNVFGAVAGGSATAVIGALRRLQAFGKV